MIINKNKKLNKIVVWLNKETYSHQAWITKTGKVAIETANKNYIRYFDDFKSLEKFVNKLIIRNKITFIPKEALPTYQDIPVVNLFKNEKQTGNHGFHTKEQVTDDVDYMHQCCCKEWYDSMGELMDHVHEEAKNGR